MANLESLSRLRKGQFNVVRDVGLTLASIVKRKVKEEAGLDLQVLMEIPPADEIPSQLPSIAVCLYHLGRRASGYVNPDQREVEEAPDGTLREFDRRPPLLLDLRYVVTAYAESHRDELSLLGLVLRSMWDADEIVSTEVVGDSIHLEDHPGIEVGTATIEEMRSIWDSFQQPYRPSFSVSVEARLDSDVKRLVRRVREAIVDFKKMDG